MATPDFVEWFAVDTLPPVRADFAARIRKALEPGDAASFAIAATPAD